jgi:lipopolysaccharide/colanic/teichoic acid biosynthesis glycosyltransferase
VVSVRRFSRALVYLGIVGTVLGLSKLHARYVADPPYSFTGSFRFGWAIAYMGLLALAAYGAGLPDLPRSIRSAFFSALVAATGAALGISAIQLVVGDALLPRFVVLGAALVLVPWYLLCVAIATGGRVLAQDRDRIALIVDSAEAATLQRDLDFGAEHPAVVAVVLSPDEARPSSAHPRPVIDAVVAAQATIVVLSRDALGDHGIVDQIAELHEEGLRIRTLSLFYEQWLGKLPLAELERVSLLFDIGEVHRARYSRAKRLIDVALGLLGTLGFVLAIPFVLLGNLISNRGPLFYRQPRVGKNGEVFPILKFRTMRPEAEGQLSNEWTQEHDPRITRFGRVLRVTHVDELPQMINILKGDLAVVGPRPEQPRYVAELAQKLPFYDLRHLVRPGLTGWAQVKYGYAGDEDDALEKLQYEFYYLRRQSLGLDLRIVGRTIRSVLGGGGR